MIEHKIVSKKYGIFTILLDEADAWILQRSWHLSFNKDGTPRYVISNGETGTLYLHRELLNAPKELEVDHINGNALDNRRENIRLCKRKENLRNRAPYSRSTKYKGVLKSKNLFRAQLTYEGVLVYSNGFETEEEAARMYDKLAMKLYGEFAKLNFARESYV